MVVRKDGWGVTTDKDKLTILGVSVGDTAPELQAFAREYKMNYPVLVSLDQDEMPLFLSNEYPRDELSHSDYSRLTPNARVQLRGRRRDPYCRARITSRVVRRLAWP